MYKKHSMPGTHTSFPYFSINLTPKVKAIRIEDYCVSVAQNKLDV